MNGLQQNNNGYNIKFEISDNYKLDNILENLLKGNFNDKNIYKEIGYIYENAIKKGNTQVKNKIEEFLEIIFKKQLESEIKLDYKSKYDIIILNFIKFSSIYLIPKINELGDKNDEKIIIDIGLKISKILLDLNKL